VAQQSVTYSFRDLVGTLNNPVAGVTIVFNGGNIGFSRITITMSTDRSAHDVASDGAVMVSYVAGRNGAIEIEVQQTSAIHHDLLDLYNQLETLANGGDSSGWAANTLSFRAPFDQSQYLLSGASFTKIADKPYQAHGQKVVWHLVAADVQQN
jgi:hypothetical protein